MSHASYESKLKRTLSQAGEFQAIIVPLKLAFENKFSYAFPKKISEEKIVNVA